MKQTNGFLKLHFIYIFSFINCYSTIEYLDTTFGVNANGIVTTSINTASEINANIIDTSGRTVVTGNTTINNVNYVFVARYNTDGTLDANFGTNGVTTNLNGSAVFANAIIVDEIIIF